MDSTEERRILVWGAGGHARVAFEALRLSGYEIAGAIDDIHQSPALRTDLDVVVYSSLEEAAAAQRATGAFVAIGDNLARVEKGLILTQRGFRLVSAIHPNAVISDSCSIGCGSLVSAGAVLQPGTTVGDHVIVNTASTIDHDCLVGDGAHLSPGVRLGGWVEIGSLAWIGIGATVSDRVTIGGNTIIGAGAVVIDDVPEDAVAWGIPARVTGSRPR